MENSHRHRRCAGHHKPEAGYRSIAECIRLAQLNKQERESLASAGAFDSLSQHRYQARWQVAEPIQDDLLTPLQLDNPLSQDYLQAPNEIDNLQEDYQKMAQKFNGAPLVWKKKSKNRDYKAMYNSETKAIITREFKADLERFNYQF